MDLAEEPDFLVGALRVRPSTRQIEFSGQSETLEPRIMQVLAALARKRPDVVSRDQLIEICWNGVVVGEDSINRCIYRLRKLGESTGAFEVETIPRVGYRLRETGAPLKPDAPAAESPAPAPAPESPAPTSPAPASPAPAPAAAATTAIAPGGWRIPAWLDWRIGLSAAALLLVLLIAGAYVFNLNSRILIVRPPPSVAVLPFDNLTGDDSKDYLAHGIAGELIETLSKIDGLQVIGRGASFSFKPTENQITVGKALNVANVLSGRVSQEKSGSLVISFELVDARTGNTILARTYKSALTTDNMAGAQRYIAEQVTGALYIAFDVKGGKNLIGAGTRSMEAYDLYLQGRELMANSMSQSEDLFAKAVAADPNYGAAWGLRAIAHGSKSWNQPTPAEGRAMQDAAYAMAKKAVTLDPAISTSQVVLANLATTQHNWAEAETASLKALDLSDDEITLGQRQYILLRAGRVTEAYALYYALDEVAPHINIGAPKNNVLPAVGRLDELRSLIEGPDWVQPTNPRNNQVARLAALIDLGGPPGAVREQLEALARQPDRTLSEFAKDVLAVFGDKEKARRVLKTWYESPGFETPVKYELIPFLAAWYGDTDLVLRVWRDDLPVNVVRMTEVWGPAYAPARARPEFKKIVQDMGLVDYWRTVKWADKCRPVGQTDFECG